MANRREDRRRGTRLRAYRPRDAPSCSCGPPEDAALNTTSLGVSNLGRRNGSGVPLMPMRRRRFLEATALSVPMLAAGRWLQAQDAGRADERGADLVVVGGGVGGCAAALAACRAGLRVVLTEPTDWIGG